MGGKQQFANAISQGMQGLSQFLQQKKAKELMSQENQALEREGINLAGITSPEARKELIASQLKGKNEVLKQQAKYGARFGELKKYGLLPNQEQMYSDDMQEPNDGMDNVGQYEDIDGVEEEPVSIPKPRKQESKVTQPSHSKEKINQTALIEPKLAEAYQKQNEEWYKDQRYNEETRYKYHKESEEYDKELVKSNKSNNELLSALDDAEKNVKSGKVKPSSISNIFSSFGEIGKKISNAFLNKDTAELQALSPQFLEGRKEIFGVRLSDADLKLLQDKLPEMSKSPEANLAVIKLMKRYAKRASLRYKIGKEIKKKNKNLRPLGFADMVEERFEEMTEPVKIVNPVTGNIIEIPAYELSSAIESGAKLAPKDD